MMYKFLHILSQLTVKAVEYRCEATLADYACHQHVIQYLNAADFFTLLMTDFSVIMTSFNKHCTNALVVHSEASGLHERNNAIFPKCLVHTDTMLCVIALL